MASGAPHEESSLDLLPSPPGLRPCEGTAVLVGKRAPKSRVSQSLQQTRKSSKHEVSCFCMCRQPLLAPPHQGPAQSSRTPCANPASLQHIVFRRCGPRVGRHPGSGLPESGSRCWHSDWEQPGMETVRGTGEGERVRPGWGRSPGTGTGQCGSLILKGCVT